MYQSLFARFEPTTAAARIDEIETRRDRGAVRHAHVVLHRETPLEWLEARFRGTDRDAGSRHAGVDRKNVQRLADIHEFGMEPDVIAEHVLEAMREDRYHIFTHPEFKEELWELFDEILLDFRDYPQDPGFDQRTVFEKTRRESYRRQPLGLKAP